MAKPLHLPNEEQISIYLESCESYKCLNSKHLSPDNHESWDCICHLLNSTVELDQTVHEWQNEFKRWRNFIETKARRKLSALRGNSMPDLNEQEQRALAFFGREVVHGTEGVTDLWCISGSDYDGCVTYDEDYAIKPKKLATSKQNGSSSTKKLIQSSSACQFENEHLSMKREKLIFDEEKLQLEMKILDQKSAKLKIEKEMLKMTKDRLSKISEILRSGTEAKKRKVRKELMFEIANLL